MSTTIIKSIAEMTNDHRLALIKRNAMSIASQIQNYQDSKDDLECLLDWIDVDLTQLKYAFEAIEGSL